MNQINPLVNSVDFNSGLDFLVSSIFIGLNRQVKPFVATIVGRPNSGKSELIKKAKERLELFGIYGWVGCNGDSAQKMGGIFNSNPSFAFIEDIGFYEISDRFSSETFGKIPDLRVYMTKPRIDICASDFDDIQSGKYRLVIENPNSKIKNPCGNGGLR